MSFTLKIKYRFRINIVLHVNMFETNVLKMKLISILTILDPDCYDLVYKKRSLTPQPIPPTTTKSIGTKKSWWVFALLF